MDRRGFFASIVAALLAPVLPLKEKWTFNRSHVVAYQAMGTLKCTEGEFGEAIKLPLYNPEFRRGVIGPFPYENGENDMYIPGLTTLSSEADPFQTFVVDTNEVI